MGRSKREAEAIVLAARAAVAAGEIALAAEQLQRTLRGLDFSGRDARLTAARVRVELADVCLLLGSKQEYARAWCLAARAFAALRSEGDCESYLVRSKSCQGIACWHLVGPAAALIPFQEAEALASKSHSIDRSQSINVLDHLGLAFHSIGRHDEAIAYQRRALTLCESAQDGSASIRLKRRLANTLQDVGSFVDARRLMDEIRPSNGSGPGERLAWLNAAAMLAEQMEDFGSAKSNYDDALDAFDELAPEQQKKVSALLSNAALLCIDLGQITEAHDLLERLVSIIGQGAAPLSAQLGVCRVRARLAERSGNYRGAIAEWNAAEHLVATNAAADAVKLSDIVTTKARLRWRAGEQQVAIADLVRLLPGEDGESLEAHQIEPAVQLADCLLRLGAYPQTAVLKAAFVAEAGRRQSECEWRLLDVLAEMAERNQEPEAAIILGKMAVQTICKSISGLQGLQSERQSFLETRLQPFEKLVGRLIDSARLPEAAHIQSLMKVERLFHFASRDTRVVQRMHDIPLRADEQKVLDDYESLSGRLREAKTRLVVRPDKVVAPEIMSCELEVGALFDQLLVYRTPVNGAIDDAYARFEATAPGTVVISYLVAPERIAAEVSKDGKSYSFGVDLSPSELNRLILELRHRILACEDCLEQTQYFYSKLLRPVEHLLADATRLELDVSGALGYLPFAALNDGEQFLVEHLPVAIRTSATTSIERPQPRKSWSVIAFGASRGDDHSPPLSFVDAELAAVKRHWPNANIFSDDDFTSGALLTALRKQHNIVHLACHYHLQVAAAHHSFLVLGDRNRFPVAALREIDCELSNVKLMVVSGCDTATPEKGRDGTESLAALLQSLGVGEVVGALWPLPDIGAAALMSEFYRQLSILPDSVSAPECLRAAQLKLLSGHRSGRAEGSRLQPVGIPSVDLSHPYFWAGLCVYVPRGLPATNKQQSATE